MNNKIKQLQNFDSLHEAEQITGKSYKEDEHTGMLGLLLNMKKSEEINTILKAEDDTLFSETTEEYLRKVTDFGFKLLYKEDFKSDFHNDGEHTESLYIMWHYDYSILLSFDTFRGSRNSGKIYYNWSPNPECENPHRYTSSGGGLGRYWKSDFSEQLINPEKEPLWMGNSWEDYKVLHSEWSVRNNNFIKENNLRSIWSGDHDCREALKNNIKGLVENGVFLKEWKESPFLWLLHHGDTKIEGYDYVSLNKERLSKLPEDVQLKINYNSKY